MLPKTMSSYLISLLFQVMGIIQKPNYCYPDWWIVQLTKNKFIDLSNIELILLMLPGTMNGLMYSKDFMVTYLTVKPPKPS